MSDLETDYTRQETVERDPFDSSHRNGVREATTAFAFVLVLGIVLISMKSPTYLASVWVWFALLGGAVAAAYFAMRFVVRANLKHPAVLPERLREKQAAETERAIEAAKERGDFDRFEQ